MDAAHVKHLEIIQSIISRLSSYSFAYRGLAVTIAAGSYAVDAQTQNSGILLAVSVGVSVLWGLDAYYLAKERQFRRLYDSVRISSNNSDMNLSLLGFAKAGDWVSAVLSRSIFPFYFVIVSVLMVGLIKT